jgi:hypothetical protein
VFALLCAALIVTGCGGGGGGDDSAVDTPHSGSLGSIAPDSANPLRDFMVMDVCVDAQGRPVAGLPTQCTKHRDAQSGEALPYHAAEWPAADDRRCFVQAGASRRYSLPLTTIDGAGGAHEVLMSVVDHGGSDFTACSSGCDCRGPAKPAHFGAWDGDKDGVSLLSYDSRNAHILASKAQDKVSFFMGPACSDPAAQGLDRFGDSWVIAGRVLPALDSWQSGVFQSRLSVNVVPTPDACTPLRSGFIAWTRTQFDFGPASQLRLEALVSEKYANAADASPGSAEQMERAYWSRELGISRWEKWERADHVRDDAQTPAAQALRVRQRNACGKPFGSDAAVTPRLAYEAVRDDGGWRRDVVQSLADGSTRRDSWYLVDCADWTQLQPQEAFDPASVWNLQSLGTILQALR